MCWLASSAEAGASPQQHRCGYDTRLRCRSWLPPRLREKQQDRFHTQQNSHSQQHQRPPFELPFQLSNPIDDYFRKTIFAPNFGQQTSRYEKIISIISKCGLFKIAIGL